MPELLFACGTLKLIPRERGEVRRAPRSGPIERSLPCPPKYSIIPVNACRYLGRRGRRSMYAFHRAQDRVLARLAASLC